MYNWIKSLFGTEIDIYEEDVYSHTKLRIKRHEGRRFKPYKDSKGILTVGYGRNMEAKPFKEDEVDLMFSNDFEEAKSEAKSLFGNFDQLDVARQGVLIEMCFQMGKGGVKKFTKFREAIQNGDFVAAATEMRFSKWAKEDSPNRAKLLAKIMEHGQEADTIV